MMKNKITDQLKLGRNKVCQWKGNFSEQGALGEWNEETEQNRKEKRNKSYNETYAVTNFGAW